MGVQCAASARGMALALLLTTGCGMGHSEHAAQPIKAEVVAKASDGNGTSVRVVQSQQAERFVAVETVTLEAAGYVAVYTDGNGAPGVEAGASKLLPAGSSRSVRIKVSRDLGPRAWVLIHREDNGNDSFDFPTADQPIQTPTGVLATQIDLKTSNAGK